MYEQKERVMKIERLDAGLRMSEAVCFNGVAYLSGQIPLDASKDIKGQTREVLQEIDKVLDKLGTSKSRVLQAQIFLKDMNEFAGMNEVWEQWIVPGHTPARATIEANLANKDWKIEILVTAAL
jgi:enamine deaminase RidA (YjgF/YER057c/UK114 family)